MSAAETQRATVLLSQLREQGAAASALCADSRAVHAGEEFSAALKKTGASWGFD